MYDAYADEVTRLPAASGLTPIDMIFLVVLGEYLKLTVGETVTRLQMDPAWQYALHLPLDHPGCTPDALRRFLTRTANPHIFRIPFGMISEMVHMAFLPSPSA